MLPVKSQIPSVPSSEISRPALSDAELRYELAPYVRGVLSLDQLVSVYRDYRGGVPLEEIADRIEASRNTVQRYISRFAAGGLLVVRNAKWGPEMIARLRELWPTGETTRAIGDILGVSRCAVIGQRDRLGLPPRPGCGGGPRGPRLAGAAELAHALAVTRAARPTPPPLPPKRLLPAALNRPLAPAPKPPAPVIARPPPRRHGRVTECSWPLGEPGTRAFHFCDAPSLPGRSYCAGHDDTAHGRARGHPAPLAGTGAILAGSAPP